MLKIACALLLVLEVGLPLLLWWARDRLMFFPDRSLPAEAGMAWVGSGVAAEVVHYQRPDGRSLEAIDARPAGAGSPTPVVLWFHGNAGNLAQRAATVGAFVRGTGARVLMAGYSGYGGNAGSPSEREVTIDGLAAYDHLRKAGVPPGRIVIYGESIGGAVAAAVAEQRECAGVVFQSTFSSLSSMAFSLYPWLPLTALLARGSFPTADRAAALRCPLLVVHGDRDEVIPFMEGKILHRSLAPKADLVVVPGARHNDLLEVAGEPYLKDLGDRFRRWAGPR